MLKVKQLHNERTRNKFFSWCYKIYYGHHLPNSHYLH